LKQFNESKKIKEAAKEFRAGIENIDTSFLPHTMRSFPIGSCGDTSLLLGTYFIEKGFGQFSYICRSFDSDSFNFNSHAWIQKENLFVDITADQFPEIREKILVAYNSKWHLKFTEPVLDGLADYRIYDIRTKSTLDSVYREIVKNIKIANKS
jgi:hypothetical protein